MAAQLEPLALAADFPDASRDAWRSLVRGVLAKSGLPADADPEAALTSTTYDGIAIRPLYTADDASADATACPATGPTSAAPPWTALRAPAGTSGSGTPTPIRPRTRQAVLDDLTNGASSIWLALNAGALPVADLGSALEGVYLDLAPIALDAGSSTLAGRVRTRADRRRPRCRQGRAVRHVRRGPDRPAGAHRSRSGPRAARHAGRDGGRLAAAARRHRRRDDLPRRRRQRRRRARHRRLGRRRVPAGARLGRARRRRGDSA